jgi:hypothetical protein
MTGLECGEDGIAIAAPALKEDTYLALGSKLDKSSSATLRFVGTVLHLALKSLILKFLKIY